MRQILEADIDDGAVENGNLGAGISNSRFSEIAEETIESCIIEESVDEVMTSQNSGDRWLKSAWKKR